MAQSRRSFLKTAPAMVGATPLWSKRAAPGQAFKGSLCFFSKHLPEMDWRRLAQNVKRLGCGGVDLTVRKGGHVAPEKAPEDLPKAVEAIRAEGIEVPMITTGLLTASEPTARPILSTAGKLSIPFFKAGYYHYKFRDVRKELEEASTDFRQLSDLAKEQRIQVGYHNHAGYIGAPVWDSVKMIDGLDPKWAGYYFDICHAVTEGGLAGWKIALNLVAPRIKMIAIKDFYWEKTPAKTWKPRYCPLGEGMVDWKSYFQVLAQAGFHGPVSLHLEYDIPGATTSVQEENTLVAAQRDLEFIKARLREAYI